MLYNLTKYDKRQITDTTSVKSPNSGGYLLQQRNIKCDKNIAGKTQNYRYSTKTNSSIGKTEASSIPSIGNAFMHIETSGNNYGPNVYVSFERRDILLRDILLITNITFYYNRYSAGNSKSLGRFRIELLLLNGQWHSKYIKAKNTDYSTTSTEWTLVNSDFIESNCSNNMVYDERDTTLATCVIAISW